MLAKVLAQKRMRLVEVEINGKKRYVHLDHIRTGELRTRYSDKNTNEEWWLEAEHIQDKVRDRNQKIPSETQVRRSDRVVQPRRHFACEGY